MSGEAKSPPAALLPELLEERHAVVGSLPLLMNSDGSLSCSGGGGGGGALCRPVPQRSPSYGALTADPPAGSLRDDVNQIALRRCVSEQQLLCQQPFFFSTTASSSAATTPPFLAAAAVPPPSSSSCVSPSMPHQSAAEALLHLPPSPTAAATAEWPTVAVNEAAARRFERGSGARVGLRKLNEGSSAATSPRSASKQQQQQHGGGGVETVVAHVVQVFGSPRKPEPLPQFAAAT